MPDYALAIKPSARRELERLPNWVLERAVAAIEALALEPRPQGCKKLKNFEHTWRIRIADWRILYIVDDHSSVVTVTRVAHRREVYERD